MFDKSKYYNLPTFESDAAYAMAMASAASSGLGISSSLKTIFSAFCTWVFGARPFPQMLFFTWRGQNSASGIPRLAISVMMAPLAWATAIPVLTLVVKSRVSIPQTSGWYASQSSPMSRQISTSFSARGIFGSVEITQKSMISGTGWCLFSTAKPTVVVHGSMPRIIDIFYFL